MGAIFLPHQGNIFEMVSLLIRGLHPCCFIYWQECQSISRSSTGKEIKGRRESWESYHLKHPLMACSSIQIFLSAVFCPFLPSSTKPVASHLCAELCVDVQVYVCAEEMEKEAVLLPNADGDCCCYV